MKTNLFTLNPIKHSLTTCNAVSGISAFLVYGKHEFDVK
jgi:hypothetical protein